MYRNIVLQVFIIEMNIYALSSGRPPSGIAIIRISGTDVLEISKRLQKKKL